MHREGHTGLTLLIFSLLMIPFGFNSYTVTIVILGAAFSFLPDIDLQLEMAHRKYTHNILAALLFGAAFFWIFLIGSDLSLAITAFIGVFGGVISHVFGDMLVGRTKSGGPWKLKPLWPFSSKEYGWGFFKSSNKRVNQAFMFLGIFGLVAFAILGTGAI